MERLRFIYITRHWILTRVIFETNARIRESLSEYSLSHETVRQIMSRGQFSELKNRRMTIIEAFKILRFCHFTFKFLLYYLFKYKFLTLKK